MPATTRLFGLILIVLGIASYTLTGRTSITAMIPAFFGAAFLVCAMVARKEAARKHAMHAAVALGLIGAIAALVRGLPGALNGNAAKPAVMAQLAMGILLLIYVGAWRAVIHRGTASPSRTLVTVTIAVLRGGLKNGVWTTVALARWRTASTVISMSSVVPMA